MFCLSSNAALTVGWSTVKVMLELLLNKTEGSTSGELAS